MTQRIELFKWHIELNLFLWTSFQYDSRSWSLFSIWLKEFNLSCFPMWLKEFNPFFSKCLKELNLSFMWTFFSWLKELNSFFFQCDSKNWFLFNDAQNWTPFWIWHKVLNLFWLCHKELNLFFLNMTQRIDPLFWIWLKESNPCFWMWPQNWPSLLKRKFKELNHFFWEEWLNELNLFFNMTQWIEPFLKKWLKQLNFLSEKYDSKDWFFYQKLTQIIKLFLENITQRLVSLFSMWLGELNPFLLIQRMELFFALKKLKELIFFLNTTQQIRFFGLDTIDRKCMSVRTRTHHEEIQSNSIWETGLLSQERSVASKILLKNVSRHPTKPPGNNILNHIERTSSTTRIDISNHLPSDRTRIWKTQLTPGGHGSYTIQMDKTSIAERPYTESYTRGRKDTSSLNQMDQYCWKLYRQSKTNRRSKRHKNWKTTSTTKFLTFNRWEQTSMHPKPVVPQLIFTTRRYRTRVRDSKTDPQHELTREDTSRIRKSSQGSGQSQQPSDQNSVEIAPRHRTHNLEMDLSNLFFFEFVTKSWTFFFEWLKELNLFFEYDSKNRTRVFECDSKNWTSLLKRKFKELNHFLKRMTQWIEPSFTWLNELNLLLHDSMNWTFFLTWLKELNHLLNMRERDTISRAGGAECNFEQATCAFRWTKFVIHSLIHFVGGHFLCLVKLLCSSGPVSRGWLVTNTCRGARLVVSLSLTQRSEPSFKKYDSKGLNLLFERWLKGLNLLFSNESKN